MMKDLSEIRSEINRIDEQMVALIQQRMRAAEQVAAYKKAHGKPVFDPIREQEILKRLRHQAGPLYGDAVCRLYQTMFTISKDRQRDLLNPQPSTSSQTAVLGFDQQPSIGRFLSLTVAGASHAPVIGVRLKNFPKNVPIDMTQLRAFLERRAPGRDDLSTSRKEEDTPCFISGLDEDITNGQPLEAIITNTDCRPTDYQKQQSIPRPGHADLTQWYQTGNILSGGGPHSGRMTAPICIAGGICLQWLAKRKISITSTLVSAGGNAENPEHEILAAKQRGDSVGGVIEITIDGVRPGLGGPLFNGLESRFAEALFAIPGVKGLEIGAGFALSAMHGSEANDPFAMQDGHIRPTSNRHGGLLGGITTGMPITIRLAMKPTPSIFKEQASVDLTTMTDAPCAIKGRHDPCIARRARPVAEALAAFVLADTILEDEAARPRICLTLTGNTLQEDLQALTQNDAFVDCCELRLDFLDSAQHEAAVDFPALANCPVILTARRPQDGGRWAKSESDRAKLLLHLLSTSPTPFAYVDLEDDFRLPELEAAARARGTAIIRSLHNLTAPITDIPARAKQLKGNTDEIPKLAFAVSSCSELNRLFQETEDFTDFPHIVCGMGPIGQPSRILAAKTHSLLTFASTNADAGNLPAAAHLSPETLVKTYHIKQVTDQTDIYAVTGWPLEHSISPEINNAAFLSEAWSAVMVPLPSESAEEVLACAETLHVRGMAVTIPHKKAMVPLMSHLTPEAEAVGAVNTVIHTPQGWLGANTDVFGFRKALLSFLKTECLEGRKVALLGAGGAANAVAFVLHQLGADVCIFNRNLEKAQELARRYGFYAAQLAAESNDRLHQFGDIIIQATSVGLSSRQDLGDQAADPIPFYTFTGKESLYDLIYSPAETPLMKRARQAGCSAENGLTMLQEQAKEQRRLYQLYR